MGYEGEGGFFWLRIWSLERQAVLKTTMNL
jgi:hypothetical protein